MGRRDYFPAFFKYRAILSGLGDAQVGRIFRAALAYAEEGAVPELEAVEAVAFAFMRQDIDAAAEAYEKRCAKNRENAKTRWDGNGESTDNSEDANGCDRMRTDAKHANTIQYNTIQNNIPAGGDARARTRGRRNSAGERMTVGGPNASEAPGATHGDEPRPPTMDDVNAYCDEAGLTHVNRQKFFDNYAASGWMRNGEPIRDWRALARKWDLEDREKAAKEAADRPVGGSSFDTSDFFAAAVAKSYAGFEDEQV